MSEEVKDDFIGKVFHNLTVIGWDGTRKNGTKAYTLKCSVCCNDSELFGKGTFLATKHMLNQGKVPCGCAKRPKWTEDQFVIRIKRVCDTSNYSILYIGCFNGNQTKITLKCNVDNHIWNSSFKSIIAGDGCLICANKARRNSDDYIIQTFKDTGVFVEGTRFWHEGEKDYSGKYYWYSSCPICSKDRYTLNSLCSGVFKSSTSALRTGSLPCRCSTRFLWSKEQREFQISEILKLEPEYTEFDWCLPMRIITAKSL